MITPVNFSISKYTNYISFKGKDEVLSKHTCVMPDSFERQFNGVNKTPPSVATKKPLFKKRLKKGQVLDENGAIFCNNTTYMFRGDLNWKNFGNFLFSQFKDYDRVNIYNYAASTGEEPYSLSILLQSKFGDDSEKFFPIYAKDLDRKIIAENIIKQMGGNIFVKEGFNRAQRYLRIDNEELKTFLKPDKLLYNATLSPRATKPVKFSCANILDDIENIDSKNPSIIMCRNMWPYIKDNEYDKFARRLYEKLAPDSVVVVGSFDYLDDFSNTIFPDKLVDAGFTPLPGDGLKLIFIKE